MRWSAPADWQKITVVRCGLGPDFLESVPKPIAADSRHFVCVARLSPAKGLPLLIQAAARLRDRKESFSIDIIGDGELRSTLDKEIRQSRLQSHVRLLGVQSSSEIRERLEQARAFVLPSFAEGLPVVLMEALALGRPVITTPVAGIPELVDDQCGWLVPFGSDEALALTMIEVLHASADELNRKGAEGRKRVRLMHDAGRNAKTLVDAIAAQLPSCLDSRRDTNGQSV
jgi:glycosyltransferase involved in cell wall biosynthesis